MSRARGYVYFIATADRSMVKIGWSAVPQKRFGTFTNWSPVSLEIVAFAPGGFMDERALHNRFKAHHSHGEWFRGAREIFTAIERIAASGEIPDDLTAAVGARYPSIRPLAQRKRMSETQKAVWAARKQTEQALGTGT